MTNILMMVDGVLFLVILFMFILLVIHSVRKRIDLFGNPPVHRLLFVMGKIGNFGCWTLFIYHYVKSFYISYTPSLVFFTLSTFALLIATVLIVISFLHLGDLNRFGLPEGQTQIICKGIYSYSRNPMYLGFYLFNVASMFYYPRVINIFLGCVGILIHHIITLAEERYMLQTFGDDWVAYTKKVRRYF